MSIKKVNTDRFYANQCELEDIQKKIDRLFDMAERIEENNAELKEDGIDKPYLARLHSEGIDPKYIKI